MSGPASDAGRSAALGGFVPPEESPFIQLLMRLRRRWWMIVAAAAVALAVAGVYLALATPEYDVTAVLMVEEPPGATSAGDIGGAGEFLARQRRALLSPPIQTEQIAQFYPRVRADHADATLTVTIQTDRPGDAAAALKEMLDRYFKTSGNTPANVAQQLGNLTAEREKLAAERDAQTKALSDLTAQANVSGAEADSFVNARRDQLAQALTEATEQLEQAKRDAEKALHPPSDPVELSAFIEDARAKGIFKELDQQVREIKEQINAAETQLEGHKQALLAQHPLIVQTQKRLDQLKARETALLSEYPHAYRTFTQQQLAAAQRKVTQLQALLTKQTPQSQDGSGAIAKLHALQAQLQKTDQALAQLDKKIRDATVSPASAMTMKLIQPPTAPDRPSRPRPAVVLTAAAAIGLLLGLALALIGRR